MNELLPTSGGFATVQPYDYMHTNDVIYPGLIELLAMSRQTSRIIALPLGGQDTISHQEVHKW